MTVMMDVDERWRPVPYYPDYEVSNTGRVRRIGKTKNTAPPWLKTLPVYGSGAGRFVKLKDRKGRIIDRNLKALVETVFRHPIVAPRNDSGEDVYNEPAREVPAPAKKGSDNVTEEWLPVLMDGVSDDLYEVSDRGRVRKTTDGMILKMHGPTPTAARWVSLRSQSGQLKVRVDQLVMEAFGPVSGDPDLVPIHINGDLTDAHAQNLRWGSRAEAGRGRATVKKAPVHRPAPSTPPASGDIQVERFARYRAGDVEILVHDSGIKIKGIDGALSWAQAAGLQRLLSAVLADGS